MPNTRKKLLKIKYKDEDSEEETGDFSDSGSEAHITEESGSDEENYQSDHSSEDDNKGKKKKSKPVIVKPIFTKTLFNKLDKQNEPDSEQVYRLKDLTEEDKLLPCILNLSESDSSDDEIPRVSKNILTATTSSVKENIIESDVDTDTEYKDVWAGNKLDNSEEVAKKTFMELEQHHTKIEATKASINKYTSVKQQKESDVKDLLALGEEVPEHIPIKKKKVKNKDESDSDIEDWEEVNENKNIPHQGLELFVEFPNAVCRKKKKIDVEMMMKRKINRVKKEQQVYMHKVHVLCWIGHGNYVSRVLNDQDVMAAALSLVPSKECYPGERVDMKYLEQIVSWYKDKLTLKQDRHEDKFKPKASPLKEILLEQIKQKVVKTKKYLVFIFVSILRALGLQCRVMFNFVTLPLKPHSSDLCSLSTKTHNEAKDKTINKKDNKNTLQMKKNKPHKEKLSQLDGNADSDFENINQVDGSNDGSPVKNRRSKRTNNTQSKTPVGQDESVSPSKISKKDTSKVKGDLKPTDKTETTVNPLIKTKGNRRVPFTNNNEAPKPAQKLSLRQRKQDSTIIKKSSKNEVTSSNISNDSIDTRKTRSNRIKTSNSSTEPTSTQEANALECETQKENKLAPPQIILTPSKVSSEYFKDKQNSKDKKIRLTRKRSQTAETSRNDEIQQKLIKTLNKSAPGESIQESKYFTVTAKAENKPKTSLESSKKQKIKHEAKVSQEAQGKAKFKTKNNVTDDLIDIVKSKIKEDKSRSPKRVKEVKSNQKSIHVDYLKEEEPKCSKYDSDEDFKPTKLSPKPQGGRQINKKGPSSDDETSKNKIDVWCEVFVEELEQWICVDIIKQKIHDSRSIYNGATHPVCYIVGWDNNNYLKDLTRRYVPHWNTITRKLRTDPEWFKKAIASWLGPKTPRDKEENEYLDRMQLEAPLPKSISEFKNHPLYALKRHLLKFEAIYPPDAATLGFIRGEAVYSRDCVYVCRSREIWLKEAKVVRLGEEPYKIVKSRPKWDKLSNKLITDKPLEIFGPWQVQDYEPPVAENGIVPRNAYGNVELFKECMLPKGTVLIKLPGLSKVAKKLNIDCAPAVTGFDYSGGWAHPVYDGFVVCQEYEELITEAWLKDQEEQELRQREKMENRVYGNWRKLIKGLLIRERIKCKYGFEDPKGSEVNKNKQKEPRLVVKKKR